MKSHEIGFAILALTIPFSLCTAQDRTTASVEPGLEVNISYEYYTVKGRTAERIARSLLANGPKSGSEVFYATTSAQTGFSYRRAERGAYCQLENVGVRTDVVMLLPQWANRDDSSEEVRRAWDEFLDKLLAHEGEHYRIVDRSTRQLYRALTGMRAQDCSFLDSQAKATIEEISQQQMDLNSQYDEVTAHGMKEGAAWPPTPYRRASYPQHP